MVARRTSLAALRTMSRFRRGNGPMLHAHTRTPPRSLAGRRMSLGCVALALLGGLNGCAALANPIANGVPVHRLPPELLAESKENRETIPLAMLRQRPPADYKIAADDVLGVWV